VLTPGPRWSIGGRRYERLAAVSDGRRSVCAFGAPVRLDRLAEATPEPSFGAHPVPREVSAARPRTIILCPPEGRQRQRHLLRR